MANSEVTGIQRALARPLGRAQQGFSSEPSLTVGLVPPGSMIQIAFLVNLVNSVKAMTNEEIARRFNRMAALMEVRGEDSFRLRSYRMAAEAIETWPTQMKEIVAAQGLSGLLEIPGVGKALAGKIVELVETGTFDAWERLTAETPATVLDL